MLSAVYKQHWPKHINEIPVRDYLKIGTNEEVLKALDTFGKLSIIKTDRILFDYRDNIVFVYDYSLLRLPLLHKTKNNDHNNQEDNRLQ